MKSYTSLLSLPEHPSEDEHEDEQHPPYPRLSEVRIQHFNPNQPQRLTPTQTFYNASTPSSSSSSIYSQSTGADTDATIYSASSAVVKMVEDELGRGKEVSFLWLDGEDEVEPVERKVEGVVGGRDSGTGEVRVEEWWEEEEEWEPWDDGGSVVVSCPHSESSTHKF